MTLDLPHFNLVAKKDGLVSTKHAGYNSCFDRMLYHASFVILQGVPREYVNQIPVRAEY